jgi:hypothetical protein
MSYTSNGGTIAEMESPRHTGSPAMGFGLPQSPVEMGSYEQRDRQWDRIGPDTISGEQRYGA